MSLDLPPNSTLADVMTALGEQYPAVRRRIVDETGQLRRFVNVYVGNHECRLLGGLEALVLPDAEISVIGSIAGGANPA